MPELPEVEVVRRGLERWVSGRIVADGRGAAPACRAAAPRRAPRTSRGRLTGHRDRACPAPRQVPVAAARGLPELRARAPRDERPAPGPARRTPPDEKHLRIRVRFEDALGTELRFVDQRTFGGLSLHETDPRRAARRHRAHRPRPARPALRRRRVPRRRCARRRTTDQAGAARPVADQRGRQHLRGRGAVARQAALRAPHRTFTRPRTAELLGHVRDVMNDALAVGGTSFDSLYVNVNGESGYFDRSLDAYGREGEPCRRCGTPMRRRALDEPVQLLLPALSAAAARAVRVVDAARAYAEHVVHAALHEVDEGQQPFGDLAAQRCQRRSRRAAGSSAAPRGAPGRRAPAPAGSGRASSR